jgi:hypothetical protein
MKNDDALPYFVGSYLNQDWPENYGGVSEAIGAFVSSELPSVVRELVSEIDSLLATNPKDADLEVLLVGWGSEYLPAGDGDSASGFLRRIRSVAARSLNSE